MDETVLHTRLGQSDINTFPGKLRPSKRLTRSEVLRQQRSSMPRLLSVWARGALRLCEWVGPSFPVTYDGDI